MSASLKNTWFVGLVAALVYMPFLGGVHLFDWDEINFAEIAREMVILGDYLRIHVDYLPFAEKPPLFFWLQAASMNVFGIGEYAARFPNAVAGVITLMTLYRFGEKLYDARFGFLWAGAYFGSVLPSLYFKSGIIDPWFNLFIFLGIYHLILHHWKREDKADLRLEKNQYIYLLLAGAFTGLGVLTKGPVAFLITALTLGVYWIYKRFRFYINVPRFLLYFLAMIATAFIWYGVEILVNGPEFMIDFTIRQWTMFKSQDAGHGGFPGYHFIVLLLGCFPASVFLIRAHGELPLKRYAEQDMRRWMLYLFWVVLILFTIVKTKIVHYSSMTYFPLTFLAAQVIYYILKDEVKLTGWMKGTLLFIAVLFGIVLIALPFAGMNVELIRPLFSQDPFASANLDADIPWTGLEALAGVVLIGITLAFLKFHNSEKKPLAYKVLFGGTGFFMLLTLILIIKKIEGISQNAAMEFYASKAGCNCYVKPEKFKSYGHLFYSEVMPGGDERRTDAQWLKYGDIDRDVFFVSKITGADELEQIPDVELLYSKNGFMFWKRAAKR
jgi:4-amino-4-deoxy-L-arabinose transferase-like glycosyltransferase